MTRQPTAKLWANVPGVTYPGHSRWEKVPGVVYPDATLNGRNRIKERYGHMNRADRSAFLAEEARKAKASGKTLVQAAQKLGIPEKALRYHFNKRANK